MAKNVVRDNGRMTYNTNMFQLLATVDPCCETEPQVTENVT